MSGSAVRPGEENGDPRPHSAGPAGQPSGTRLIIWRHGNTDWNRSDRVQGQTDAPLNDLGRGQARASAPLLAAMHPVAIVSSDLSRAADTAAALAALTGLAVRFDERLRERYYGQWEGYALPEIADRFPEAYARWRAGEDSPGCDIEGIDALAKRVGVALQEAVAGSPDGTVVVVSHGGGARQGVRWLLGWPPEIAYTVAGLDNCHWAELRRLRRGWRLWAYNMGPTTRAEPPLPA